MLKGVTLGLWLGLGLEGFHVNVTPVHSLSDLQKKSYSEKLTATHPNVKGFHISVRVSN